MSYEETARTNQENQFCRRCGKRLLSDSLFCTRCGTEVIFDQPPAPPTPKEPITPAPPSTPSPSTATPATATQSSAPTSSQNRPIPKPVFAYKPTVPPAEQSTSTARSKKPARTLSPGFLIVIFFLLIAAFVGVCIASSQNGSRNDLLPTTSPPKPFTIKQRDIDTINGCPEFFGLSFGMSGEEVSDKISVEHRAIAAGSGAWIDYDLSEPCSTYGVQLLDVRCSYDADKLDKVTLVFSESNLTYESAVSLYREIYGTPTTFVSKTMWSGKYTDITISENEDKINILYSAVTQTKTESATPSIAEEPKTTDSPSTKDLVPLMEPTSGTIISGSHYYDSEITVTASSSDACLVKLKTSGGIERLSFYVRAGETVTVGVPAEYLRVYFACGDTWYGQLEKFGPNTTYSKDDELLDFTQYTWEYTLYPVYDGNFEETPISESEFD